MVIQAVPTRTIRRSTAPPEPERRLRVQRTIEVIPAQNRGKIRNIGFSIIAYTTRLVFTWQSPAFRADGLGSCSGIVCASDRAS